MFGPNLWGFRHLRYFYNLLKERMLGILVLKDCEGALLEIKPEDMADVAQYRLKNKAITYIKMVVSDEILLDLKGLMNAFKVWKKLKATYEITTPVIQVHHLMRKLVCMQLDESRTAVEPFSAFTSTLSQQQEFGLPPFDDKLKAIFLLMILLDLWVTIGNGSV